MRAAGVRGDVAADRARLLRRRVRRVVQPEVVHGSAEVEIEHSGLDPGVALVGIDLEDLVQVGGDDDEWVADGRGSPGEAGAAPPGYEGTIVLRRDSDGSRDIRAAAREAHRRRIAPVHPGVTLVERELQRLGARPVGPERGLQIGYERVDLTAVVDM